MKIEKVNENQIRCTLTKEDLASRELKLSELAYGTEKAKSLFRDMMQQANFEFGFEAEDIPLMIEAIPLNGECIVLIITKVEDPEELDTRFSRFSPSDEEDEYDEDESSYDDSSDNMLNLFNQEEEAAPEKEPVRPSGIPGQMRGFAFTSLSGVMDAAKVIGGRFVGENTLYKDAANDCYLLLLVYDDESPESFNRVCNILSEYGTVRPLRPGMKNYLEEHCDILLDKNALSKLAGF